MAYLDGDAFLVVVWNPIFFFAHIRNLSYVVPSFNPFINTWLIFSDFFADLLKLKFICKTFLNIWNIWIVLLYNPTHLIVCKVSICLTVRSLQSSSIRWRTDFVQISIRQSKCSSSKLNAEYQFIRWCTRFQ